MLLLNTTVIIDHLRTKGNRASDLLKLIKKHPKQISSLSMISVQELYEGASTLDSNRRKDMVATISPLKILPYTYEVAKLAGTIARDLDKPIQYTDAAIAASAIIADATLVTHNGKDFGNIRELKVKAL